MKPTFVAPLVAVVLIGAGAVAYFAVAGAGSGEEAPPAQLTATPMPSPTEQTSATPTAEPTPTPAPAETPTATPTPAPAARGQLWRWVNVTVVIPEDSDVFVFSSGLPPDGAGYGVEIRRVRYVYQPETLTEAELVSSVLIDAETGAIVREEVLPEDRAVIDEVLRTLKVGPLHRATAPWPYSAELPGDLPRETTPNGISFITPSSETGLQVYGAINDPGGYGVGITNGRSTVTISLDSTGGLNVDSAHVVAEDREVLERWASQVKLCGVDLEC
jgi:hypothetical protein